MKGSFRFLVVALLLALAHALPRALPDEERPEAAIYRWLVGGRPTLPNGNNDDGNLFAADPLRTMGYDLDRNIRKSAESFSDFITKTFTKIGELFSGKGLPEGGNTTSVTQRIDGHVVTTNLTTYDSEGDDGNFSFRLHIIDIKPESGINLTPDATEENSGVTTTATDSAKGSTSPKSVESLEDKNEIPDSQVETLTA
ncbi:icarapin-like [Fopius arisanus]|uniref:ICA protein n=1 Tax=Fopius arisanus TaxID=64838 RepID=A0A0C9RY13_9HYME|nr:PREDICTED: icarapin-like [Fopius arisanus]